MKTFLIGLLILLGGGIIYGRLCEHVFQPDNRTTPAIEKMDGMDFVPMNGIKVGFINLLNIAGTGPILGPIQGILFGPIAFITIPIGCVIGGAVHDYFTGMIACREGGLQMPDLISRYVGVKISRVYTVFISILMLLVGTVFVYTPGDIAATQIFGFSGSPGSFSTWAIYGVIFIYYLIATVLPIDKIIGRIYPIFGAILLLSTLGLFIMLFVKQYPLIELWGSKEIGGFDFGAYFSHGHFVPIFFVTVACGILSGFHSTQTTMMSRTLRDEREGRGVYYNMMITEGFIAMVWSACTMAMISIGADQGGITMKFSDGALLYMYNNGGTLEAISATSVVGVIARNALGSAGGIFAILGVIILSVTTGDTALRSMRLMLTDLMHIPQDTNVKRLAFAAPIFALVCMILIFAKSSPSGFSILWRYFGWGNQTVSIFALSMILIWMMRNNRRRFAWMPAIPLIFYSFVVSSYILNAQIGFRFSWNIAYCFAAMFAVVVLAAVIRRGSHYSIIGHENK